MLNAIQAQIENLESLDKNNSKNQTQQGVFEKALKSVENKIDSNVNTMIIEKTNLLKNPDKLKQKDSGSTSLYSLIFNYIVYFMIRLMIVKLMSSSKNATKTS